MSMINSSILQGFITPATIFFGLVMVMLLDTIRLVFLTRGNKTMAWSMGLLATFIYVLSISNVFSNLDNLFNIMAYAAGFATGNVLGLFAEEMLAIGHIHLKIISSTFGLTIAQSVRAYGIGVTEVSGRGKNGYVAEIHCGVHRKDVSNILDIVHQIDPTAFITANEVRPIHRGFWHKTVTPNKI